MGEPIAFNTFYERSDMWNYRTAKIWKKFECVYDLIGHSASVWAVLALEDDQYLTGMSHSTCNNSSTS